MWTSLHRNSHARTHVCGTLFPSCVCPPFLFSSYNCHHKMLQTPALCPSINAMPMVTPGKCRWARRCKRPYSVTPRYGPCRVHHTCRTKGVERGSPGREGSSSRTVETLLTLNPLFLLTVPAYTVYTCCSSLNAWHSHLPCLSCCITLYVRACRSLHLHSSTR